MLADTEQVWNRVFQSFGENYKEPQLVIFERGTRTACGVGMTQMGPFYCPLDQKIYIDLAFYDELKRRFNAPGDFARPTSSPTKWVITSRPFLASPKRSRA